MPTDSILAVYGTLQPGRSNHHHITDLDGTWREGTVRARFYPTGAGAAAGYPAIVLDPDGEAVPVDILESRQLRHHWRRLDAFEGAGYHRVLAEVTTSDGPVTANIYELAPDSRPPSGSLER